MSVNKVDKTTGELVTLANGTRMWIGTKSLHDSAVQQGTMPDNCMVCITDDFPSTEVKVTTVTKNGVTAYITRYDKVVTMTFAGNLSASMSQWGKIIDGLPTTGRDFYLADNQVYLSASGNLTALSALSSGTAVSGSLTYVTTA